MDQVIQWGKHTVTIADGMDCDNPYIHDLGTKFPFIGVEDEGVGICIPNWAMTDAGQWQCLTVSVRLDDLVTDLLETERILFRGEALEIRGRIIESLRAIIHKLENDPLQIRS
jgi:hypothetical protein